ncbi:hypothetical protein SPRG_09379 [Saprolegnia parasitica CBS 223.65]|uniref:Fe2OG dioxygenase domain-containing protein n=1 Tax=Saprolegnia parasitica (strain CBS 223.65) TaxID=695850 RepID=A0A067CF38_SAPPC|nr:hypothetical protein SPRG_09379 [Saprolegnia parasitica CBS 223.65]KDO25437.1 hypothetical protein SPRG_09379 [Saprolegnia parasitica CBS 223.65]|eukprot:XP_012203863.1 hypothetical protein SPRG_09379 [Saprolegnia parasitica CBS 223.65]
MSLPIIDLSDEATAVAALDDAFSTFGCCYIKGHGINLEKEKHVMKAAHEVFRMPSAAKKLCERPSLGNGFIRGYIGLGGESGSELIEVKEAFSYGYEWPKDVAPSNPLQGPNVWPPSSALDATHQRTLRSYFTDLANVSTTLTRHMSVALGQSESYFGDYAKAGDTISIMRAFHYFPYDKLRRNASDTNFVGSSPHTDWGFLTLILQDPTGGLQFLHENEWIDVPYIPGTIVVNGGDYLSLLTKGKWVSPIHRVVSENTSEERYSMVFFYYPDYDARIPKPQSATKTAIAQEAITSTLNTLVDGSLDLEKTSFGEYIASKWAHVQRSP